MKIDFVNTLNSYFNPGVKDDSDLAEGTCSSCIVTGISLIVASLTAPAIVSGSTLIRNNVSLMGMSFVGAGITKKKGYVLLPAVVGLSVATYIKGCELSNWSKGFYKRNIKPLVFEEPLKPILYKD